MAFDLKTIGLGTSCVYLGEDMSPVVREVLQANAEHLDSAMVMCDCAAKRKVYETVVPRGFVRDRLDLEAVQGALRGQSDLTVAVVLDVSRHGPSREFTLTTMVGLRPQPKSALHVCHASLDLLRRKHAGDPRGLHCFFFVACPTDRSQQEKLEAEYRFKWPDKRTIMVLERRDRDDGPVQTYRLPEPAKYSFVGGQDYHAFCTMAANEEKRMDA